MYSLKNKVIVITGAGSGIGRALAIGCARRGARLALSDVNASALATTREQLPPGAEVKLYPLDVSQRDAVFAHADDVRRDFGTAHYVINNAGTTIVGTIEHLSIEEIEWQLSINLWGVIYGTKAFLPSMLAQQEGCIVNVSSIFGLVGYPAQGAYNISKFGVRGFTECLWTELHGTGVRAVSVHPGGISTNIDSAARLAKAANATEQKLVAGVSEKLLTTPPEQCAEDILRGLERGDSRILTGNKSSTIWWLTRLLPNVYPAVLRWLG